jgi:hypothetical protein
VAGDPGLMASGTSTGGGALSVLETTIGAGPPLHVHDLEDECFQVLGGELCIEDYCRQINNAATDEERHQVRCQ